jgi:hypothetical protein
MHLSRFFFLLIFSPVFLFSQKVISRKQFFNDTSTLQITLKTDIRKLQAEKENPRFIPAEITLNGDDTTGLVTEKARIKQRGNNRRETCNLAALMLDFSEKGIKTRLSNLDEMKWVTPCYVGLESEQWLFKEFLIYKIYNLFTEKSHKVRLLNIRFEDARGKLKPYSRYGFAIEPIEDLAKRNESVEETRKHNTEGTNRDHMTQVALFQYMIGNTDWAVPIFHNIKLLKLYDSLPNPLPFVIPYDFDYAGAVNTSYSTPYEGLPIKYTTDRHYLGFRRSIDEINVALEKFRQKEQAIYDILESFPHLSTYHRKDMVNFIKSFYKLIENEKLVKEVFVNGARIK